MTREEAIKHLSEWMDEKMWRCFGTIDREAIGMAIEALSDRPTDEWCTDCKEYDHEKHCCPRFNRVIRTTLNEAVANLKEEFESAEAEWIPCNKQMPDELEAVNVTWVNHNPPPYYKYTEDVPLVDSAVYYRGKWYWWDATVIDVLAEYGEESGVEPIDKDIEVVAWMPLPKPYKGGDAE